MNDACRVCMIKRIGNFGDHCDGIAHFQPMVRRQFRERRSADIVTDDVQGIAVAADFVCADDIRMSQLRGGACLAEELLNGRGIELFPSGDLDRHGAIEKRVTSLPDRPEPAHPKALDEFEVRHLSEHRGIARAFRVIDETEGTAAARAFDFRHGGIGIQVDRAAAMWTAHNQATGLY